MPPARLHMTLCVMKLLTPERVAEAETVIRGLQPQLYDACGTRSIVFHLEGLHVIGDDPGHARVVYTRPREDDLQAVQDTLDRLSDICLRGLRAADLLTLQEMESQHALNSEGCAQVTVHATLMNVKYSAKKGSFRGAVRSLDARKLLKDFSKFDFGQIRLAELNLSCMTEFDAGTGFYKAVVRVPLP
eukprot:Polyplicarium_translucidae@DN998_c0_g1_i2.p3